MEAIRSFAAQMVIMRRYLNLIDRLTYSHHKHGWFLEALDVYCEAVTNLQEPTPSWTYSTWKIRCSPARVKWLAASTARRYAACY
jgi:hypothetical protein